MVKMIEINFLPWREKRDQYQKKKMRFLLFYSGVLSMLVWMSAHYFFAEKIAALTSGIAKLNRQMDSLSEKKITEPNQALIDKLISSQLESEKLIAALANTENPAVCFTEISRDENRVSFIGNARSIVDLTEFIKHWRGAELFSHLRFLDFKKQANQSMHFHFYGFENNPTLNQKKTDDDDL